MIENKKQLKEKLIGGWSVCFNEWALDKRIKSELPLLMIISSLSSESGVCFASNLYLANLFDCTEISISQKINKLRRLGYISVDYEKRGCEVIKRFIRLKKFLTDDYKKFKPTIKKVFKDNNTSNNNKSFNISPKSPKRDSVGIVSLVSYFKKCSKEEVSSRDYDKVQRWLDRNNLDIKDVIDITQFWIDNRDDSEYAPQVNSLGEFFIKFDRLTRFYENNC